jgi:hypothetical protein
MAKVNSHVRTSTELRPLTQATDNKTADPTDANTAADDAAQNPLVANQPEPSSRREVVADIGAAVGLVGGATGLTIGTLSLPFALEGFGPLSVATSATVLGSGAACCALAVVAGFCKFYRGDNAQPPGSAP